MIVRPSIPVKEFTITVSVSEMEQLMVILGHSKAEMDVDRMYKSVYDVLIATGNMPSQDKIKDLVQRLTFQERIK